MQDLNKMPMAEILMKVATAVEEPEESTDVEAENELEFIDDEETQQEAA